MIGHVAALVVAAFVAVAFGSSSSPRATVSGASSFSVPPPPHRRRRPDSVATTTTTTGRRRTTTNPPRPSPSVVSRPDRIEPLSAIVDVPDGFFTLSGFAVGLALSVSKVVARVKIEERAWEQRLEEGRERRLSEDLTLTELDLRREEASGSRSAMGGEGAAERRRRRRRRRKNDDDDDDDGETARSMTDDEIDDFETRYGIEYDPYYDEPYSIDELPDDVPFREDKQYGDRMYENGEVFYRDAESGSYYRQGSKPRLKKFWNF